MIFQIKIKFLKTRGTVKVEKRKQKNEFFESKFRLVMIFLYILHFNLLYFNQPQTSQIPTDKKLIWAQKNTIIIIIIKVEDKKRKYYNKYPRCCSIFYNRQPNFFFFNTKITDAFKLLVYKKSTNGQIICQLFLLEICCYLSYTM